MERWVALDISEVRGIQTNVAYLKKPSSFAPQLTLSLHSFRSRIIPATALLYCTVRKLRGCEICDESICPGHDVHYKRACHLSKRQTRAVF